MSESTRVRSPRSTSTPSPVEYSTGVRQVPESSPSETSSAKAGGPFVSLAVRTHSSAVVLVNVAEQRELEIRERIRKFLED